MLKIDITNEMIDSNYVVLRNILLADYSQKNFDIFIANYDEDFLKALVFADIEVEKELSLIEHGLRSKNILMVKNSWDSLLLTLQHEELTQEFILESDMTKFEKATLLEVNNFYQGDHNILFVADTEEMVSFIASYILNNEVNIMIYLGIFYEYYQVSKSDMDEERKTTVEYLLQIYLEYMSKVLTDQQIEADFSNYASQIEALKRELTKKDKVIEKTKKKLAEVRETSRAKFKGIKYDLEEEQERQIDKYKKEILQMGNEKDKLNSIISDSVSQSKYNSMLNDYNDLHKKYCDRGKEIGEFEKNAEILLNTVNVELIKNYYKIKKEFKNKVIYSDADGSNMLLELI